MKSFGMVEKNWGTAVRIVTCLLMILLAGKKFPGVQQLITTNFCSVKNMGTPRSIESGLTMRLFVLNTTAIGIMAIMGASRFDYGSICSREFWTSPSFGSRCLW